MHVSEYSMHFMWHINVGNKPYKWYFKSHISIKIAKDPPEDSPSPQSHQTKECSDIKDNSGPLTALTSKVKV